MTLGPLSPVSAHPSGCIGISAHRGASISHPENTLSAFRAALAAGTDGVETDIGLSRDGIPVLLHDDTVDRTTNGTGAVGEFTAAELRALDAGAGEGVPTLDLLLTLIGDRAEINIELKDPDSAGPVLEVVRRHPNVQWFCSSAEWGSLEELRRLDARARIYPLSLGVATVDDMRALALDAGCPAEVIDREYSLVSALKLNLDDALEFASTIDAEGISVSAVRLDAAAIARVHAAGLRVWTWTINDLTRATQLIDAGVDVICTDNPVALLTLREQLATGGSLVA
ncbi:glycerophosphodiester phosphodiesterase family protein [Microbacterium sediminicola]|uniref:Glycerophosphodiester phosphodiesterase family protein n=1 Tax=Microbacterium sediminicola TaxID=415210 RepID=A0ABN2IFP4_9MICO